MRARLVLVAALVAVVAAGCGDAGSSSVPPATATTPSTAAGPADPGSVPPATPTVPSTVVPTTSAEEPAEEPAPPATTGSVDDLRLALAPVPGDFEAPVLVAAPLGDGRLFVVDQPGVVWVLEGGEQRPFLDIQNLVSFGGERGLLGLAFHPDFASNGRLFVHYTDRNGDTTVAEYTADGDRADPASARRLLGADQPAGNHNGGMIAFGPDGYLWIALGDGGGADDRFGQGQRPDTLLGALLRLDVDGGDPYAVPPDNPFVAGGGAAEVWAYGLRNPWRFSFDEGFVYVADVGQNEWEEVSVVPVGEAGVNYGWPIIEANECFRSANCSTTGLELPAFAYDHGEGCSITGGFVYRGAALPELAGQYFYGDFCAGFVRSWDRTSGRTFDWTGQLGRVGGLSSFGVDGAGELYVTSLEGGVWRLVRG